MKVWEFACVMASVAVSALLALTPAWGGGEADQVTPSGPPPAVLQVPATPVAAEPALARLTFGSRSPSTEAGQGVPSAAAIAPGAPPVLLGIAAGPRPTAYLRTSAGPAKARVGDTVAGWRLVQLRPTSAVMERDGQRVVMRLFSK